LGEREKLKKGKRKEDEAEREGRREGKGPISPLVSGKVCLGKSSTVKNQRKWNTKKKRGNPAPALPEEERGGVVEWDIGKMKRARQARAMGKKKKGKTVGEEKQAVLKKKRVRGSEKTNEKKEKSSVFKKT